MFELGFVLHAKARKDSVLNAISKVTENMPNTSIVSSKVEERNGYRILIINIRTVNMLICRKIIDNSVRDIHTKVSRITINGNPYRIV